MIPSRWSQTPRSRSPRPGTWCGRPLLNEVVVAMAGIHQLWRFDPVTPALSIWAGTRNEGLLDGALGDAWFAQPSGVTTSPDGSVWLVDSETSALRKASQDRGRNRCRARPFRLRSCRRTGGEGVAAAPLGVTMLPDGSVAVADTYNGAVRRYDPATGDVSTLATGLAEPSDLVVVDGDLVVVESGDHRLTRLRLPDEALIVDGVAQRTAAAGHRAGARRGRARCRFHGPARPEARRPIRPVSSAGGHGHSAPAAACRRGEGH